jgi:hypothetical protein
MSTSRLTRKSSTKITFFASILALFLLGFATAQSANAQTSEPYSKGAYQFSLEDGYTKYVEFESLGRVDGSAVGQLTITDEAPINYQDVDGTGDKTEDVRGYYIKAEFDSMTVSKNKAVMSGIVRDSSVRDYIGQRVLLTVVDNGDNTRVADQVTWGVYKQIDRGWVASDAERKEDEGVGLRWWATDAERKDDVGYAMPKDEKTTTQSFPVAAYTYWDIAKAAGDILVRA